MWDWVSFVVGLWAGVVGLLIVANFAAKPMVFGERGSYTMMETGIP